MSHRRSHLAGWRNGRRASLRCSCPLRAWEFESPLGDSAAADIPRRGRRPAGPHKAGPPGSIPGPGPFGRARPVVQRLRLLSYKEETGVQLPPGRLQGSWSAGVPAARLHGREEDRVRFSGGPSTRYGRAAGPTERHLACNQEIGVRLPGGPSGGISRAHGLTEGHRPGVAEVWVRVPVGPLAKLETEGSRIRFAGPPC
jgi:hypothetical protein